MRGKDTRLWVGPDTDPDRYLVERSVAKGGEGELFRGSITVSGLTLDVAIKQLLPDRTPVRKWQARWSEQVELLRTVHGPGVVAVREGFAGAVPHAAGNPGAERTLYLIMNWVEGEPLHQWVKGHPDENPVDTVERLRIVATALDEMHAGRTTGGKAVLHRDIKPPNILVNADGAVLVDFGLIRALPDGPRKTGLYGTPGYIAPEIWDQHIYEPATDRYGFGAAVYYVFTRDEPPYGYDPVVLRSNLAAVPALAGRPRTVDHLMQALDADPSARPDSLRRWVDDLRDSAMAPSTILPSGIEQRVKDLRTTLVDLAEALFALEADPDYVVVRGPVDGGQLPPAAQRVVAALGTFWEKYSVANGLVDKLDAALAAGRTRDAERLLEAGAITLPDGSSTAADPSGLTYGSDSGSWRRAFGASPTRRVSSFCASRPGRNRCGRLTSGRPGWAPPTPPRSRLLSLCWPRPRRRAL